MADAGGSLSLYSLLLAAAETALAGAADATAAAVVKTTVDAAN